MKRASYLGDSVESAHKRDRILPVSSFVCQLPVIMLTVTRTDRPGGTRSVFCLNSAAGAPEIL